MLRCAVNNLARHVLVKSTHHTMKFNQTQSKKQAQGGFVMLGTTIVILAAALVIAVSVEYLGVGELLLSFGGQQSEQAFEVADSCVREALLQIKRDNNYTGSALNVGPGSCIITVTVNGSTRTISSAGTVGQSVRKITVGVSISGTTLAITSWSENTQ